MTCEIKSTLADLGVVTKTDVEAIVESHLAKRTNTLKLQILKDV